MMEKYIQPIYNIEISDCGYIMRGSNLKTCHAFECHSNYEYWMHESFFVGKTYLKFFYTFIIYYT